MRNCHVPARVSGVLSPVAQRERSMYVPGRAFNQRYAGIVANGVLQDGSFVVSHVFAAEIERLIVQMPGYGTAGILLRLDGCGHALQYLVPGLSSRYSLVVYAHNFSTARSSIGRPVAASEFVVHHLSLACWCSGAACHDQIFSRFLVELPAHGFRNTAHSVGEMNRIVRRGPMRRWVRISGCLRRHGLCRMRSLTEIDLRDGLRMKKKAEAAVFQMPARCLQAVQKACGPAVDIWSGERRFLRRRGGLIVPRLRRAGQFYHLGFLFEPPVE